ncbi:MAG: hypothetical protein LBC19_07190 [Tannerella sp.]|jgi:predicted phage tail protein|nr:hypothetical protein [Tannerella sp.]
MRTKEDSRPNTKSCIIANPIYDTVFKRLMENERIAKFFLGTILEEQIVDIDIRPQEFTYKKEDEKIEAASDGIGYSIFRIDFMATIRTKEGEEKKILIEVQKSWDENDLMRFRNYLGEQYRKVDKVNGVNIVLPITTIYILGFNLAGMESACIKVERNYRDMIEGKTIEARTPFIEKLTHNSYVIQAGRITDRRYSTKLDKLLSIFEQAHFITEGSETGKQYPHPTDDEDIRFITSVLHEMITDPEERKEIEREAEALRIIDDLFGKKNREQKLVIEEQAKALEEQAKALGEQAKALEEQAKVLEEKDKAIEDKDKALEEQSKAFEELKRQMEEMQKQK